MSAKDDKSRPRSQAKARAERLAAELRANLKRRKEKARTAENVPQSPPGTAGTPKKPAK